MNSAAIKTDLIDRIKHADDKQLKELQGLVLGYFNVQEHNEEEWNSLPEEHRHILLKSLAEADAGLGRPFDEVTRELREKYGLNG